jgi:hypothetical protein
LDLVVCIMHIFFIHWKTFHLLLWSEHGQPRKFKDNIK